MAFLDQIIKCPAKNDALFNVLHHACYNARGANTTEDFMAQLKEDRKAVAKKV